MCFHVKLFNNGFNDLFHFIVIVVIIMIVIFVPIHSFPKIIF